MGKREWVRCQNTLRDLAAAAARQVDQFDLAEQLSDRDLENEMFARVVDAQNCNLDVDCKSDRVELRGEIESAVLDAIEELADAIECERCAEDVRWLYHDKKFRASRTFKAYAGAVTAFAKTVARPSP